MNREAAKLEKKRGKRKVQGKENVRDKEKVKGR